MESLTPMMAQYKELKDQHPHSILMFRLGDFYEMFFADAEVVARELELVLTGRDGGKALGRVPMCGVPFHALDAYVARLVEKGHRVAICDQVEDPKLVKGLVRREVTRVITPGTIAEPRLLEEKRSTYLAAVCQGKSGYGLAYADLSTGEFAVCELTGAAALREVQEELARLEPREVLLEAALSGLPELAGVLGQVGAVSTPAPLQSQRDAYRRLADHFGVKNLRGFGCDHLELATRAAGAVLAYLQETQKTTLGHVSSLRTYTPGQYMVIDPATRRNLELVRSARDGGRRGSLLAIIDRSVTAMGGRLLRAWLERPLLQAEAIRARHGAVGELVENPFLRSGIRDALKSVQDLERLMGRVVCGTANARDLVALGQSLGNLPLLLALLADVGAERLRQVADSIDPLEDVRQRIGAAIALDPPATLTEGNLIRDGFDPVIDELRLASREGKDWMAALEVRERERTGVRSLKVGFNKVFGYYLEITRANLAAVPEDYQRKQTLAGGERYVTPELKAMEDKVLGAEEKLAALEYDCFLALRSAVAAEVLRIQSTARAVAELDVLAALGEVATAYGYCRPEIHEGDRLEISGGRHPVVERVLPEGHFVPNDCLLDTRENRLLLITGPNMGGKSTYMRQVALTVLLAQMGSYVPAASARVGLVDRIFTRVGAADDLATGQSTFMVEMNEVSSILHGATPRSLVVLDEIGRGTATFDGLSIAWAVAEYICDPARIGAKTLFATHYHELCELEGLMSGVCNYSVAVRERGEDVAFLYQIVRGGADRSYGIQVARLAGLPRVVVDRAREILGSLEQQEGQRRARRETAAAKLRDRPPVQLALFERRRDPVVEELLGINVMALTPLEALNLMHQLQKKAQEG